MQLLDAWVQVPGEVGEVWRAPERSRGHDHIPRAVLPVVRLNAEAVAVRVDAEHPDPQPDRQLERARVGLHEVRSFVLARVVPPVSWEAHPRQPVIPGGAVQAQRLPLLPPAVPDAGASRQDQALAVLAGEVVGGGESRLSRPDDDGLDEGVHTVTLGARGS